MVVNRALNMSSTVRNIIAAGQASGRASAELYDGVRSNSVNYTDIHIANMRARAGNKIAAMKAAEKVKLANIVKGQQVEDAKIDVKADKAVAAGKKQQRMAGVLAAAGGKIGTGIYLNSPEKRDNSYLDAHTKYIQTLQGKLDNYESRGPGAAEQELSRQLTALQGRPPTPITSGAGSLNTSGGSGGSNTSGTISQGSGKGGSDLSMQYMDKLTANGMSKEQAAATVGHLLVETGGFKHMEELAPNAYGTKGYGHLQWTDTEPGRGRRTDFLNYTKQRGLDPKSFEANSDFLVHEITTNYNGSWTGGGSFGGLQQQGTLEGASAYLQNNFIRPGVPHTDRRLAEGRAVLQQWEQLQQQNQ